MASQIFCNFSKIELTLFWYIGKNSNQAALKRAIKRQFAAVFISLKIIYISAQNYVPLTQAQNWLRHNWYFVYLSTCVRQNWVLIENRLYIQCYAELLQIRIFWFSLPFICFKVLCDDTITIDVLLAGKSLYLWQCSQAWSRFPFLLNFKILLYSIIVAIV